MALGTITSLEDAGLDASSPIAAFRVTVVGDDAYTTGGTVDFSDAIGAVVGHTVTLLDAHGLGLTAGAVTHLAQYDAANDTLLVFQLSDGTQATAAADLSGVTFSLTCMAK